MISLKKLYRQIAKFLMSLPNIGDIKGRQAFLNSAGLEDELIGLIPVDEPPAKFVPLLISTLLRYGKNPDEEHPLVAVLEASKDFVGGDKQSQCDVLLQELRLYIENNLRKNYITEERCLDAAMPQNVRVNQPTELITMIRLPDSEGLRKILEKEELFQANPSDTRTKKFELQFPCDEKGNPTFIDLGIEVKTDDFKLPEPCKEIRLYPSKDSDYYTFTLIPQKAGTLTLLVQVYLGKIILSEGFFKVNGQTSFTRSLQAVKTLISLPIRSVAKDQSKIDNEFAEMLNQITSAKSRQELKSALYKIESFLVKYPKYSEAQHLKTQTIQAIKDLEKEKFLKGIRISFIMQVLWFGGALSLIYLQPLKWLRWLLLGPLVIVMAFITYWLIIKFAHNRNG